MANNLWWPHGLIQDKRLEAPYLAARVTYDPDTIVHNPKEHLTIDLWSNLFQNYIFESKDYYCGSQVPPGSTGNKACDLAIRYYNTAEDAWHILCFAGAKRASNQEPSLVRALERQALDYCKDFLAANPNLGMVYACTLIGTRIRCWKYQQGDRDLKGFWGKNPPMLGAYRAYLDVGRDEHRAETEAAFDHMRPS